MTYKYIYDIIIYMEILRQFAGNFAGTANYIFFEVRQNEKEKSDVHSLGAYLRHDFAAQRLH